MKDKLKELREKGAKVYSFSKLGSFQNCEYEYYNSYVDKKQGIPNVYTIIGSEIHNGIESLYKNEIETDQFKLNFENKITECEMLGYGFPNENIGSSFKSDLNHFMNNFKKIEGNKILEKLIVFEIDGIWMQGYIDCIMPSDKGKPYVNIYDWKTSSKFSGKKLNEAGRQLLLYKIGIEQCTNLKVDKIQWFMIKYINVCYKLKNGKTKKKMCSRGKWVKEMRNQFAKDLLALGTDEFEVDILLDEAEKTNDISHLPEELKIKYWLEDCVVEYEITDERIEEVKQYVKETVHSIESKEEFESSWKPIEINKYNSFYCSVLCGHRKTCKFYKDFLDKNSDGFKKKKDSLDLDDLFK